MIDANGQFADIRQLWIAVTMEGGYYLWGHEKTIQWGQWTIDGYPIALIMGDIIGELCSMWIRQLWIVMIMADIFG
jgi:hypothetical protein